MTHQGGIFNFGVIFSFDPSSNTCIKLVDFDGNNGAGPSGSLIQADDGKLYGMTSTGGSIGGGIWGIIFSFDPSSSTYTKLIEFDSTKGFLPFGSLIQAQDEKLYGMTLVGGKGGLGVIFSFDPFSSTYTKLRDFDGPSGLGPYGNSLMQAMDGKLYGMTVSGGDGFCGVIFSFDPNSSTYNRLKDFEVTDGCQPWGNLMQARDKILYGMSRFGGSNYAGVVFSLDPSSSTFTKLQDYNGANGANPYIGSAFIEVKECSADTTYYRDADKDGYGNFNDSIRACSQPTGYVKNSNDCSDNNAAIHAPVTYYRDADGDGFGDASHSICVCESLPPAGYVTNNYDCEDFERPGHGRDEMVVMCHQGKEQCTKVKEINKKMQQGWTLGPCNNGCSTADATLPGKEHSVHNQYRLSNYPNPFTASCTIQYELPFDSKVSIKVYDVLGRPVAVLVNDNKKQAYIPSILKRVI